VALKSYEDVLEKVINEIVVDGRTFASSFIKRGLVDGRYIVLLSQ